MMAVPGRPGRGLGRWGLAPRRGVPTLLLLILVAGCGAPAPSGPTPATEPVLARGVDAEARAWIDGTLAALTLEEAVGQLVFPWIPGAYASVTSDDFRELVTLVDSVKVGGLLISIGSPLSYAAKLNELQSRAELPLLVTSDFENGGPGMRINHAYALPSLLPQGGGTSFPPTMAFGAIGEERFAAEYGRITAVEARAVGVHLNFAPVLDVNSNPENPVINTRSFGEEPEAVARLGAAYIRGAGVGGVFTTAKHFPGHGDTRTDSHIGLPVVSADRARMDRLELVPFRRAVEVGVDAVMTAHVAVPGVLGPDAPPATLSPYFMTELLRGELGFQGILFTDALRMGAITEGYGAGEAGVRALEAGSDVLLAPADPAGTVDAVARAVRAGRISRVRIDASVRRILELKARAGLHRSRLVSLERVDEVVGSGAHLAFADSAASRSITLPRDRDFLVPLSPEDAGETLVVTYARSGDLLAGVRFRAEAPAGLRHVRAEPGAAAEELHALTAAADSSLVVLVNAYVPPVSGSGSVAVDSAFARWVSDVAGRKPTVVASFGNPYLLTAFPEVGSYLLAWGDREVSQAAAAGALFGEAPITGRLPVSIPPLHRVGEGLRRIPGESPRAARTARPRGGAEDPPMSAAEDPPTSAASVPISGMPPVVSTPAPGHGEIVVSPLEAPSAMLGVSSTRLAALDTLILDAIADSATPGAALAVGYRGRLLRLRGYGHLDWDEASAPATPTSLYDLASLTKVVGTTTAAMLLVQEGRLELDAPVVRYLPWWRGDRPGKSRVTVRQLLLHEAGLPPYRRFFREMEGREAFREAIGFMPLEYPPGERSVYSDIGLMTAAFVVEEITGTTLDRFLEERVWRPLGMHDTHFRPGDELLARVAPTEVDTVYRNTHVRGVVHDENAYAMGGVAGHAGLFSSARDLAVFAQMMVDRGAVPPCRPRPRSGVPCSGPRAAGERILDAALVDAFTRRHGDASSRALGWDTPSGRSSAGTRFSSRSFGHTGFTGTSLWIDPTRELFVVLLTNRVNPTRDNDKHVPLRRTIHDAVVAAVEGEAAPW